MPKLVSAKVLKRIALWIGIIAAPAGVALGAFQAKVAPRGYFHAYPMIHHNPADAFDFEDGIVTLKTCCGETQMGTYSQTPEGEWIWHFEYNLGRTVLKREFLVQADLFSLRIIDLHEPYATLSYRRRIVAGLPF